MTHDMCGVKGLGEGHCSFLLPSASLELFKLVLVYKYQVIQIFKGKKN